MRKKPLHWSVLPAILAGSLAALSGLGKLAVDYATQAKLPERVEAAERKNVKQDEEIVDLKGIAKSIEGYTQAMNQQLQQALPAAHRRDSTAAAPRETTWTETDAGGVCWSCVALSREACWGDDPSTTVVDNFWRACEADAH